MESTNKNLPAKPPLAQLAEDDSLQAPSKYHAKMVKNSTNLTGCKPQPVHFYIPS